MVFSTPRNLHSDIRWMSFYNDSGETVPPYAAMQITKVETTARLPVGDATGEVVLVIKKSTKLTAQYDFVINGDSEVPPMKLGYCSFPREGPVLALVNNNGGPISFFGGSYCPVPGTWGLIENSLGFQRMQLLDVSPPLPDFRFTEIVGEQTIEFLPLWMSASPCTSFWGSRISLVDAAGNPDPWPDGETRKVAPFANNLADSRFELFRLNQWGLSVHNKSGENFTGAVGTFMWDYTLRDSPNENGDGFWYTVSKECFIPTGGFCPGYEA